MNILSLHASHDGAISISSNNKLIVHTQLERFNKHKGFSNPDTSLIQKIKSLNLNFDKVIITDTKSNTTDIWKKLLKFNSIINEKTEVIEYSTKNHHLFHVYCAMYNLNLKDATYVVIDGTGDIIYDYNHTFHLQESFYDNETPVYKQWYNNSYDVDIYGNYFKDGISKIKRTHGIGDCYAYVTEILYDWWNNTGKTMALTSYGKKDDSILQTWIDAFNENKILDNTIKITDDKDDIQSQNILKNFQLLTEEVIYKTILAAKKDKPIVFTGGVAMNVLANTIVKDKLDVPFYVDPMCNDQGISLGALNYHLDNKLERVNHLFLGFEPDYNFNFGIKYEVRDVDLNDVSKILNENPIAFFNGRSEQGQRGLGNRSLIINPTLPNARELVNQIKEREWYRPFACSILEDKADEWFDIKYNSPYMLYVYKCKQKEKIKSVLAIDDTCRLQTVNETTNKNYYDLLKTFNDLTNIPLVLNTSLNMKGHTLVEDLQDLYNMMENTNLKYAYLAELKKLIIKK